MLEAYYSNSIRSSVVIKMLATMVINVLCVDENIPRPESKPSKASGNHTVLAPCKVNNPKS